jgi:hypothetical protein
MAGRGSGPEVIGRTLLGGAGGGVRWLDAVREPQGRTTRFRTFFAAGTARAALEPSSAGAATITGLRDFGAALLLTAEGPGRTLALDLPEGRIDIPCAPAETRFLAGRNVIAALRGAETVETLCDWLAWHAAEHGLTGAVIVNRAPPPQDGFAAALDAALRRDPRLRARDLRIIVLHSPLPLGKPGLGPETHAFLCPDAPGKDRMDQPAPDPWLAPLGEPLLYELLKWRFLARARAVLALDCCDLLAPRPGLPSAFDLCHAARGGVILLAGRRIYPWRVRAGRAARFSDHVCRQFDARRGIARWGVAPERAGLEKGWRATRVSSARPEPGQVVAFWRAMGLKAPGWKASQLAPKTSLIEDPALLDLATGQFGAKPVRPPVSAPRPAAQAAPGATRTCIVTTMKNEGPFILEWLAYHRSIGVSDVLVYTNDCTDGTDALLDLLQARGLVQHRLNPYRSMPGLKPQHAALEAAESEPAVQGADWVICMDVDEFVNIRLGDGTLAALYAAMGGANMIALTWRMFGNADVIAYQDRFVTEQFTLAAPEMVRKPHQAWGFKTLFRNIAIYKKLGVHRPKGLRPDLWTQVKWLNGSGAPMPRKLLRNGWRSSVDTVGYDWVQLNHYACRSVESFLVKRDRGRVNHVDRDQGVNYWFRMNHNAVEDRSILPRLPRARAEWARLIADPAIRAAHETCVAAHRARIAALRARPEQAALFAELAGERLQKLSRMLQHFGASVFNAGPASVPPDLHRMDLPENFLFTVEHQGDARH